MRNVAILGYGLEGKSLFSYLKKDKQNKITILDQKRTKNYLKNLSRFDVIFRSPGVPYNFSQIQKVKNKVSSLTRLFFEEAKKRGAVIIGITGSVGKTTTATILHQILKKAKKDVFLAGNIGVNPLQFLGKLNSGSIVVMELSSFQLQDLGISPKVAIVLDIYEEHLDKHKSFKEYISAKANIARFQKRDDVIIFAKDNRYSKAIAKISKGRKIPISTYEGLKQRYKMKTLGAHNFKNALAAQKAASLFGVSEKISRGVIENFRGIEHRIEFVRNIGGVKYFNNSKATNIASALAGVDSIPGRKIVLSGGHSKNLNFTPLVRRFLVWDVKRAIYFGECAGDLVKISKKIGFSRFSSVKKLKDAVDEAGRISEKGDTVILSPGTSSFDEFKNYEERGRRFKKYVRKLG